MRIQTQVASMVYQHVYVFFFVEDLLYYLAKMLGIGEITTDRYKVGMFEWEIFKI